MLVTLLSWLYIAAICLIIGIIVNVALSKLIPTPSFSGEHHFGITGIIVTGIVTLTVYAEFFSIVYKIGALCHGIVLLAAILGAFFFRKDIKAVFDQMHGNVTVNKLIIYVGIILTAAFFTSNGKFHTDTGIYHAQAIRMLEEYGVLKGLGNLQLHFAYNSSYLALCALFTLSFILPFPLHTMTGFFMVVFSIYAADGLFDIKSHKRHGGDLARIAILIYSFTNLTGLQSPATDYGTMFMTLYILCAWITYTEERKYTEDRDNDIAFYGYLSVLAIFTVSMKLSAALIVVIAVLPAAKLLKERRFKDFWCFIAVGFFSFLPFMIRNVILSGYLFYPVASIDLFNVVWKIPADYMKVDADQIKVWGRCLFDVRRVDEGITSWFPIWWENKQHYEVMLIYSQLVGAILTAILLAFRIKEKKLDMAMVLFYAALYLNIIMWLFTAPFIRYGLAFLLLLPLCAVGDVLDIVVSKRGIVLGVFAALVLINFCSWVDNYFMDDMVFLKHNLMAGHYVVPVPFDEGTMTTVDMDGLTVYVAGIDEINSYYANPGSCYDFMVERTELIGDSIKEGFKPRQ